MRELLARLPAEILTSNNADETGALAGRIGRLAIRSLYREVALSPKPGLVSPDDSGSHQDMDFGTFLRSLHALREYFPKITNLGASQPSFEPLRQLGVAAEAQMMQATGGINTHRGAIFNLGLLCAAVGVLAAKGQPLTIEGTCAEVTSCWGDAIMDAASPQANSHGADVLRRYGCGGARIEAAKGFPAVKKLGLPAYQLAARETGSPERGAIQCFFALMAELDDTNLLWRGGQDGLRYAQARACEFLTDGGVYLEDWRERAQHIHNEFVLRDLSPGGSADLLGVTLFLDGL